MPLAFNQPDFAEVSSREWLVTNGIGGYASSSLCGANTRRYHGLLVASFNPPTDRRVLVSKIEETVIQDGDAFSLSTNAYPGVIHPQGYQWLQSFEREPLPYSIFQKNKIKVGKTVFMRHESNSTVVEYENLGEERFQLQLIPLLAHRDYHQFFKEGKDWKFEVEAKNKSLEVVARHGLPSLWIHFTKGKFEARPDWYRNFQYEREIERGLDYSEDLKSIGTITCALSPGEKVFLVFSTDPKSITGSPAAWKKQEEKRLSNLSIASPSTFIRDLSKSGNQFLVRRQSSDGYTIIAGYPWFTDWGRDTMIAMRGLVIATGKKKIAESIFETFLTYLDGGMIPNRFPDHGEKPEYNNMDGTLWLFVALHDYLEKFGDLGFIKRIFPKLKSIVDSHLEGTRYNIHVTKDGLLYGGEAGTQLTWMDAKVHGYVVTPRIGCPVEINALWYNALCVYMDMGKKIGEDVNAIEKQRKKTKEAFVKKFIHKKGYLYDVIVPDGDHDDSIRPNQIYAISLPYTPLDDKQAKKILAIVEKHLYTPYGLRSLSPKDENFKAIFHGDPWSRDNAYHQGTVWSHLWGEYALAYLRVHKYSGAAKKYVQIQSGSLEDHFYNRECLQGISEVFDGAIPNAGKGCIHQAWSVGNTLLALLMAES